MAHKFLYYLGAGASAQALPTVKPIVDKDRKIVTEGFAQALRSFSNIISSHNPNNNEQRIFLQQTSRELMALADQSKYFATVDTYAKYLYLKDREAFDKLKQTLATFFSLLQLWENKLDNRYLSWITSVMSETTFPENIKILTWNYDFQMQLGAEKFKEETFRVTSGSVEHSPPLINYWPAVNWEGRPSIRPGEIALLHLNGVAGSYFDKDIGLYNNIFLNKDSVSKNSTLYPLRTFGPSVVFSFAWETGQYHDWLINTAQEMIEGTTIMVVIGYSFPFFNRDIDKAVFKRIVNSLRKIYFQDPFLDGSFLKAQFNLPDHIQIIPRKETDSFYIPHEL